MSLKHGVALIEERDSRDDIARNSAEGVLSALEARGREIGDGDALWQRME